MPPVAPFVPEGFLAYADAVTFVVEQRSALARLLAVGETRGAAAPHGASVAHEAQDWLRHNLAFGDIRMLFVCDVVGVIDMPAAWFETPAAAALSADGRPDGGFLHRGHLFQGHITIEAASLARVVDNAERRSALWRERATGVLHDPRGGARVAVTLRAQPKAGRPHKYDHQWLAIEVANIFYNETTPPLTRAGLIALLQERYHARFGEMPDATTLRPLAREVFQRLGLG